MGVPFTMPYSLPKAIRLPVKVRPPSNISNPRAPTLSGPIRPPKLAYSAAPTRAAAKAPKACESAVRSGMAVIGIQIDMAAPIDPPIRRPIQIH